MAYRCALELAQAVAAAADVEGVAVVQQAVEDGRGQHLVAGDTAGVVLEDERLALGARDAAQLVGVVAVAPDRARGAKRTRNPLQPQEVVGGGGGNRTREN